MTAPLYSASTFLSLHVSIFNLVHITVQPAPAEGRYHQDGQRSQGKGALALPLQRQHLESALFSRSCSGRGRSQGVYSALCLLGFICGYGIHQLVGLWLAGWLPLFLFTWLWFREELFCDAMRCDAMRRLLFISYRSIDNATPMYC